MAAESRLIRLPLPVSKKGLPFKGEAFLYNENPRIVRGFQKAYSYE